MPSCSEPQLPTRTKFFTPKKWMSSYVYSEIEGMPMPVPMTDTGVPRYVPVKPSMPRTSLN